MIHRINEHNFFDSANMTIFNNSNFKNNSYDYQNKENKLVDSNIEEKYLYNDTCANKSISSAGAVPTFNCNLRCSYCSQSSSSGKKDLDIKNFKIYVEEIIKKRLIYSMINKDKPYLDFYFTGGGEPTFNWNLFCNCVDLLNDMCSKNDMTLNLHMTTNAYFSREKADYISKHFKAVMISYDGTDMLNTRNRLNEFDDTIANTIKENIKYISERIDVTIRSTLFAHEFKYMRDIRDNISNNFPCVKNLDINPVFPVGRALNVEIAKDGKFMKQFLENFIDLSEGNDINRLNVNTPILSIEPVEFGCGGLCNIASEYWLFPDNKIRTCVDSYDNSVIIGEIRDYKFIYNNITKDAFKEDIMNNIAKCNNCIALPVCGYGCPLKRIRDINNGTNYVEAECEIEKEYWKFVLNELIKRKKYRKWELVEDIYMDKKIKRVKYVGDK